MASTLTISGALRAARAAARQTQTEAAQEIGCSLASVCLWESDPEAGPASVALRRAVCEYVARHLPGMSVAACEAPPEAAR